MSEITVETGELPVCVNCQLKHAVGLLHHMDPSMEKEKYDKTIELINEIGEGLMMTSTEIEDFIKVYQLEHKVEDVLTVARDLRHKIMEGSDKRFEAMEEVESEMNNPSNPPEKRKLVIEKMAESEGLGIKKIGEGKTFLEFNIYSEEEARYAINRIAGKLKRRGCVISRFGDPNSIKVRCSKGSHDNPAEIPERCEFTKESVKPKGYFDPDSFRTICPECPDSRCANCPPELTCATRIIIGCKEGEFVKGRCQVGTEAHVIYHG